MLCNGVGRTGREQWHCAVLRAARAPAHATAQARYVGTEKGVETEWRKIRAALGARIERKADRITTMRAQLVEEIGAEAAAVLLRRLEAEEVQP
jgi:hypothetical protein